MYSLEEAKRKKKVGNAAMKFLLYKHKFFLQYEDLQ